MEKITGREWIYLNPPATLVVADCACSRPYSKEYALSLTPSLLLSAKKRRLRFGFFAVYALRRRGVLPITVYPIPFFALLQSKVYRFPLRLERRCQRVSPPCDLRDKHREVNRS